MLVLNVASITFTIGKVWHIGCILSDNWLSDDAVRLSSRYTAVFLDWGADK